MTFGLFKADPYFVPGSERFAKPKPVEADQPQTKKKSNNKGAANQAKSGNGNQKGNPNAKQKKATGQTSKKSGKPQQEKPPKKAEIIEPTTPRLFVGNLSYDAAEDDIQTLFAGAGEVDRVEIITNHRSGRSKGYGFVTMKSVDDAKVAAKKLHDVEHLGRKILVSGAKSEGKRQASS